MTALLSLLVLISLTLIVVNYAVSSADSIMQVSGTYIVIFLNKRNFWFLDFNLFQLSTFSLFYTLANKNKQKIADFIEKKIRGISKFIANLILLEEKF